MHDADCIFCKIAKDEIPSQKAQHEEDILSMPDIQPLAPGHTLVIPVPHYRWFYEIPDGVSDRLFRVAKRLAKELKEKYSADYVRLEIVGKDVPHVHVHLIPQKFSDKATAA
jgi:histidine triad (HIT) family protein